MNKPLFNKPLFYFACLLLPAICLTALGVHMLGYPAVSDFLIGAALVLCAPTVLTYSRQAEYRDIEKKYGSYIINAFGGEGRKSLRCKLVDAAQLLERSKYRKAAEKLEALEKQCTADADYAAVQMLLGDAYHGLGNDHEAELFYRDSLSHVEEQSVVWSSLGVLLSKKDNHDEAIRCHLKAVKYDDRNSIAYNNLAAAYYRSGEYEKCIEPCLQCLKLDPRYASPAVLLSAAYYRLGNVEKSNEYYRMVGLLGGNQKALDSARAEFDRERQTAAQTAVQQQAAQCAEN